MKLKVKNIVFSPLLSAFLLMPLKGVLAQEGQQDQQSAEQNQQTETPTQEQINHKKALVLSKLHLNNQLEIKASEIALQKTESEDVKALAELIQKDHTNADKMVLDHAEDDNIKLIVLEESPEQAEMMQKLEELNGKEFDLFFVKSMEDSHTKAIHELEAIKVELKNTAPVLSMLIDKLLPTIKKHRDMAEMLFKKLNESSELTDQDSQETN